MGKYEKAQGNCSKADQFRYLVDLWNIDPSLSHNFKNQMFLNSEI